VCLHCYLIVRIRFGCTDRERATEHQKVAEKNEEDLLMYYAELFNDWQEAIERGFFADKRFTARQEELATLAQNKQT
jgi:hypothetical protein